MLLEFLPFTEPSQLILARAGNDENYEIVLAEMMPIS